MRPIRRFPTPPPQPVRGPAPGLPPPWRQTRVLSSPHLRAVASLCLRKDRKGAYSHTHSAGFLGTHAGPDKCIMLTRESRPVKLWGLCTGAAACGRGAIEGSAPGLKPGVNPQKSSTLGGARSSFPGGGSGSCVAAVDNITQESAPAKPGAGRPTGSPPRDTGAKG